MAQKTWFPEVLTGERVVLRRHVPANVTAFLRWYADPEIARLARYQATPMRPEEIERFFAARVAGPESLAMAVHEKATDRLIGTCAFSQLDGDNGSALYHITIGEADASGPWLRDRGDPADGRPRLRDARVASDLAQRLRVRRARDRAYVRVGFLIEGRSRESIWRDGRWWDELAMSVLVSDWKVARAEAIAAGRLSEPEPVAARGLGSVAADAWEMAMTTAGLRRRPRGRRSAT